MTNRLPLGYEAADKNKIDPDVLRKIRGLKETQKWPLVLSGDTGTGKTMAAACLYASYPALPMWHRADDLLLSMAVGRTGGVQVDQVNEYSEVVRREIPFPKFVNRVTSCCCLFLDDLGVRKPTDSMQAALFDLLEWRLGKPLVITTNLTKAAQIAELFDDRIASRMIAGTRITLRGADRRTMRIA